MVVVVVVLVVELLLLLLLLFVVCACGSGGWHKGMCGVLACTVLIESGGLVNGG